jgi:hypothetical protein
MDELIRRLRALERRLEPLETVELATPVVARYITTAGQSIPDTTITIVDYGTLVHDTNSLVTTGASWAFTAKQAGYYHVDAALTYASSTTWALGEAAGLLLYKNGVLYSRLDRVDNMNSAATAQFMTINGSDVVYLAVGDSINIRTNQTTGGALALFTGTGFNYVSIVKQ